ncbi:MAG TPA: hypothetical protein VFF52_04330 [Isosphaeraceae bacterium]|nr:hypothetical protein [Isosphaeraceae bacterium]
MEAAIVAMQKDTVEVQKDSRMRDAQFSKALESLDRIEKALGRRKPARE